MDQPIKIATFNAENFSLLLDKPYTRSELEALDDDAYRALNPSIFSPNKDRAKIAAIGAMILEGAYDVVGLCEVGGRETLEAFNRLYLENRYETYLYEENSTRGIFVGALVKRGRFGWVRSANMPGSFARNLLKLSLGLDRGGLEVFVVHLKSQFGADHGIGHRLREVEKLATLVRPQKCVVMGDFNGILIRGEAQFEYDAFLALPFTDVLEARGVPANRRRTHYHFGPEPHFTQLDYLFCSNDLTVVDGGVVEGAIPLNRAQREFLPSDHLMVWAEVAVGPAVPTATLGAAAVTHQGPGASNDGTNEGPVERPGWWAVFLGWLTGAGRRKGR